MLIPIRLKAPVDVDADADSGQGKRSRASVPEDLLLVELQGNVEPRTAQSLDNLPLGNLTIHKNDKATLVIGNHLLTGKMVKMGKPFLAVRKVTSGGESSSSSSSSSSEGSGAKGGEPSTPQQISYEIVSLIRNKYIFTANPTPLNRYDPRVKCPLGMQLSDAAAATKASN